VHDGHLHLFRAELAERRSESLDRALDVRLDDELDLELIGLAHATRELFERDLLVRAHHAAALAMLARFRDLLRFLQALDHVHGVARRRYVVQTDDSYREGGTRFVRVLPAIVEHRAYLAESAAGEHHVAAVQRTRLHQHRSDRTLAAVELGLDDDAARQLGLAGTQLQ